MLKNFKLLIFGLFVIGLCQQVNGADIASDETNVVVQDEDVAEVPEPDKVHLKLHDDNSEAKVIKPPKAEPDIRIEDEHTNDKIPDEDEILLIKDSAECFDEVKRLCSHKVAKQNILVINCLDQAAANGKLVNQQCQNFIWNWKKSQTTSEKHQRAAMRKCNASMVNDVAAECAAHFNEPLGKSNKLIPCLLDYRLDFDDDKYRDCRHFLTEISLVVFSDYRLICNFVEQCQTDITKYGCGRETFIKEWLVPHSQGEVVNCLEEQLANDENALTENCALEIVNLAELSADDFQLDRHFYLACRDDRDQFCGDLAAGEGRIYQCLFKNKFSREMSAECVKAIEIREKLIFEADYDAGYHLHKKCKKTFQHFGCDKSLEDNLQMNREYDGLSQLLLCVEKKMKSDQTDDQGKIMTIDDACDSELQLYREYLMSDYELSPDVVVDCSYEIKTYCGGMKKQGETLHCLMNLEIDTNSKISSECDEALYELVEVAEADTDFHVDFRVQSACGPIVNQLCSENMLDDADILQCLLENLHSPVMIQQKPQCRKALLEVQYFLARDFSFDKKFRHHCSDEVEELCGATDFSVADDDKELIIPLSLIINCLYSHSHPDENDALNAAGKLLSGECTNEVHRIMQERSMELELNDELDKACKPALGEFCSEMEMNKGSEFLCLQSKYEDIAETVSQNERSPHRACLEQLDLLTGIASEELDLEQVLFQACEPMVRKFCSEVIQEEDEGQVLGCLINHKNDMDMNEKCRAGVYHFQIISLDNYKLTYAFFKACKSDIKTLCRTDVEKKSKSEIVHCLSGEMRDSVLTERDRAVSLECQKQVTFELLGEFENIKLNPKLRKACEGDVIKFCNNVKSGGGKIQECLRTQEHNLSKQCHKEIFAQMEIQAQIPIVDFYLMRVCKAEMKSYCKQNENIESVVDCLSVILKSGKNEVTPSCTKAVRARKIVADKDIRLNPQLEKACKQDIPNLCMKQLRAHNLEDESKEELLEGKIISCLKDAYVNLQSMEEDEVDRDTVITKKCAAHIEDVIEEEADDFELDPELMKHCSQDGPLDPETGICNLHKSSDPVECLKKQLMNENLIGDNLSSCRKYVAKLIKETQFNVEVDATLQNACSLDIKIFCSEINPGHGRRIACLVNQLKSKPKSLGSACHDKLNERQSMWSKADTINDFAAIVHTVQNSSQARTIVGILAGISFSIMFCGIYIGRLTASARARKSL